MVVIKEYKFDVGEGELNHVEEVEHELIKDSVIEMANTNFTSLDDIEDMPMGNIRKHVDTEEGHSGKPVSRDQYLKQTWTGDLDKSESEEYDSNDEIEQESSDESEENEDELEVDEEEEDGEDSLSEKGEDNGSESEIEDDDEKQEKRVIKKTDPHEISIYSATTRDTSLDIEKGKAIKNQLSIWENLVESRIKLQKALVASNKLYQPDDFDKFKASLTPEEIGIVGKAYSGLVTLLDALTDLQKTMLNSCGEYTQTKTEEEDISKNQEDTETKEDQDEPKPKKRKLSDYSEILEENHKSLKTFRDTVIQKWNDKTRVLSGKISNSDFSAFEQSTLKQIEQILCDKTRLISRTQIKRSKYKVLGKKIKEIEPEPENQETEKAEKLNECDTEIFDDDDFYHKILRDFIERKTTDITDPNQLGKQWTELQKLRSKMKRKIDTRATKGRKLRFTVHNKLVNFMAPVPYTTWTDESEEHLFKSLFGKASMKA